MKNQRGITLIALVITIIVLLVLAGVTLSLVLDNNGVLTQSKNAVEKNRQSTAKEEVEMAWTSAESYYYGNALRGGSCSSTGPITTRSYSTGSGSEYLTSRPVLYIK